MKCLAERDKSNRRSCNRSFAESSRRNHCTTANTLRPDIHVQHVMVNQDHVKPIVSTPDLWTKSRAVFFWVATIIYHSNCKLALFVRLPTTTETSQFVGQGGLFLTGLEVQWIQKWHRFNKENLMIHQWCLF